DRRRARRSIDRRGSQAQRRRSRGHGDGAECIARGTPHAGHLQARWHACPARDARVERRCSDAVLPREGVLDVWPRSAAGRSSSPGSPVWARRGAGLSDRQLLQEWQVRGRDVLPRAGRGEEQSAVYGVSGSKSVGGGRWAVGGGRNGKGRRDLLRRPFASTPIAHRPPPIAQRPPPSAQLPFSMLSPTPDTPRRIRATTILAVRRNGRVAIGGDGQVTVGETVMKSHAQKVRLIRGGRIVAGFAGAAADAMTLFEKFEEKLERYPGNMPRAAVELAKDWRSDRVLRRLEALLIVADKEHGFIVSGTVELIEPDDGILAIGSGGSYALAAARALVDNTELEATDIVSRAMKIAGDICIYTNTNISVLETA